MIEVEFELFEFIDLLGLGGEEVAGGAFEAFFVEVLEVLFIFEFGDFGPLLEDLLELSLLLVQFLIVDVRKLGDSFLCAGDHY